jgi:hypothetical protein
MELHEIEVIRLQSAETGFHSVADVVGGVDVVGALRCAGDAPALRGEDVLVASVGDRVADDVFAAPVVDRGVDEVDTTIEQRIEQGGGVVVVELGSGRLAA